MTKEEAIYLLKQVNEILFKSFSPLNIHEPLNQAFDMAVKALEQQPSEDCVSRQAVLGKIKKVCFSKEWAQFRVDNGSNGQRDFLINYIEQLPPVTPTRCIAAVRFSKEDLREICNERIEIECTHNTCKDCKRYNRNEMFCTYHGGYLMQKCDPDFYCADFEKRGNEI